MFCFSNYLQNKYFVKWVFFYSLKRQLTNTIPFVPWNRFTNFFKVLMLLQGGCCSFQHMLASYHSTLTLVINIFAMDYGILSHQSLVSTIVLPWLGSLFMSIILICHCHPLILISVTVLGLGVSSQLLFTTNRASYESLFTSYPFLGLPALMEFLQAQV